MGGLVVKKVCPLYYCSHVQAIVDAYQDSNYSKWLPKVKGVIFIGTPHHGADMAGFLNGLLSVFFQEKKFVKDLVSHSGTIMELNKGFKGRVKELQLVSFYEQAGYKGIGVLGF
jgi:triacylglycerol esterase/lipase EstA (alpha/beta hydrolase family)